MTESFHAFENAMVTPGWLTQVLRQSGTLPQGEVKAVDIQLNGAFNSLTSHLTLRYSDDAPRSAPTRLVLKRNTQEDWCKRAQAREVRFYKAVAALPELSQVIVPCYVADYDEQSGNSYLLLQDVSETHREPVTREETISTLGSVPRPEYIEATIDTLATIQAFWWEHPLLKTEVARAGEWLEREAPGERYARNRAEMWEQVLASKGGATLPEEVRSGYTTFVTHLASFWEKRLGPRFYTGSKQTLLHGDAYFSNFLCPRHLPGNTYLIDWQGPEVHIGALDLANMLATFWTRTQRNEDQRELRALQRYYQTLTTRGVCNYSWEELLDDYRVGLIEWLFMPVWDACNGSPKSYWWPKMQCLFHAAIDWQCLDFVTQ